MRRTVCLSGHGLTHGEQTRGPLDVRRHTTIAQAADVPHLPYPGCPQSKGCRYMRAVTVNTGTPAGFDQLANIRTDCYVLLASLLARQPSEELRDILQKLAWDEALPGGLDQALNALRQAAH